MSATKNILLMLRKAPYDGYDAEETVEMLLAAAAFDQNVSVLFLEDGVLQLLKGQQQNVIGRKYFQSIFQVFGLYEVKACYVAIEALQQRGLAVSDLLIPVTPLTQAEIAALLRQQDIVWGA